ncbi:MAG TPA: HAD family hydrolase [Steroidobacteraceae bacterium]|jgi:HAD superfamily hydrolase (TIGR01509 family)|nr:HAD family hydrolase [Steroidobacteraceae bacterium]
MNDPLVLSFDLDDTLWPVEPVMLAAEAAMLAWLREYHPLIMHGQDRESLRAMRARIAQQFPDRSHDMTFLRHRALAEMFAAAGQPAAHADEAFEVFYAARNRVTLYDEVENSLERLSGRYRLFALSNGNADLKRCGIAHWFEGHITAISAGAAKPDIRIFTHLLDAARVQAGQVLHIGDDPHLDVMGATQAGMQAVWLNRDAKSWPAQLPPPSRTIMSLEEIN